MKVSLGLRGKVLLASAAAVLAVALASATAAALFFVDRQQAAQQSRTQAIADALAIQLERILTLDIPLNDLQGFDEQCDEALLRHAGLSFALVTGPDGKVLFRSARRAAPEPALPALQADAKAGTALRSLDGRDDLVLSPVLAADGTPVATVVVGHPRAALVAERNRLVLHIAAAATLALLVVLGLLHLGLSRVLMRPLGRVVQAVAQQRAGDRQARVHLPATRTDELALLAEGFNGLVQTVDQREQELVTARDAAEQASRAKSQFLAMMSHEMRTPLNAVLGMAEVLARSPLDTRQQHLLGQMRSSGRLLADIIADLLDLSAVEAGRLRVASLPFSLRDALTEGVDRFRDEAHRRGLWLTLDLDPALPERLLGDALRVQQVLGNLLSNALKFTEHGGVRVSVTPMADHVRVAVADTGVGIDEDFLPHVYEAFRQADGSLSRRFGGAGLGLSIARALCDAMGGRIDVASRVGRGTTFWFELPLRLPDDAGPPEAGAADGAEGAEATRDAADARVVAPHDVLLVEDNEFNRCFVRECLDGGPVRLTLAKDGTEGLARLYDRQWDAVLLDWQLPGLSGRTLLKALRGLEARQGWSRTPVIVTSAHASDAQRQACLAAGADDFLAKPFSADALDQALLDARVRPLPVGKPAAEAG